MSYPPQTLLDLREYLHAQTGLPYASLGIVGDANHTYGYHLGKDRLPLTDYSTKHPRDRAGLSNAASAIDVGRFNQLDELTAWMVAEARAGRRPDTREIIGPRDGRAYRWARENGWRAELRADGDSHEGHAHESFYRDSEYRDKVRFYRPFFEGDDVTKDEFKQWLDEYVNERAGGTGGTSAAQRAKRGRWRLLIAGTPETDNPETTENDADSTDDRLDRVDKTLADHGAKLEQILAALAAGGPVAHTHEATTTVGPSNVIITDGPDGTY